MALLRNGQRLAILRPRMVSTVLAAEHDSAQEVVTLASQTVRVGWPERTLVSELSLAINEGERWAILGANGCGKSTLVALIGERMQVAAAAVREKCGAPAEFQIISFEAHQRLLQAEARQFRESRFESLHMRATPASFLHPHLYPSDPEQPGHEAERISSARTRLTALPLRYDTPRNSPLLAELETAASHGPAARLLHQLGLFEQRHSPLHGLSTGEGRKLMLIEALLSPPRLLVLDEAFDGLDVRSRSMLGDVLRSAYDSGSVRPQSALALIAHRPEDLLVVPTHALLLGQGPDATGFQLGSWEVMEPVVDAFFASHRSAVHQSPLPKATPKRVLMVGSDKDFTSEDSQPPIVELKNVTVKYPMKTVFDGLSWTVRQGEKWVVAGANGSGKSTLLELITGDNMQGYQNDVRLFGKKKGDGVSIWEIKEKLGIVSTKFHMEYVEFSDPARQCKVLSTWDVVCSGLFDSIGLYKQVSVEEENIAREWVHRFELTDLVTPPAPRTRRIDRITGRVVHDRPAVKTPVQNFHHLSFGEQKLVLLCRAMVKQPPLLLLDEPTHGLSGAHRDRLLGMLSSLINQDDVTIVYVSHHQDEIDSLAFENVLQL